MALPSNPEFRTKILKRVEEAVQFLREIDTLKEDVKELSSACKEEFEYPAKEFNALLKAAYDEAKVLDTIETLQTSLSELDILRK
jgi:DNA-binding transcriptional regulator GbsR (MarR family)